MRIIAALIRRNLRIYVRDRAGGPFGEGGDDVEQGRRQINDQGEDDQDEMGDLRAAPPWGAARGVRGVS